MANPFISPQFSGPYATALANAVDSEIQLATAEIAYMHNFNYQNTVSGILVTAGQLVGYLWPYVPSGLTASGHLFSFYSAASGYVNPHFVTYSGFGSVTSGGTLSGLLTSFYQNSQVAQQYYSQLLPLAAQIKYNGLTLSGIDAVCQYFGPHTIAFASSSGINPGDVLITFNPDISALQLNLANQLFIQFATEPQVFLYNA